MLGLKMDVHCLTVPGRMVIPDHTLQTELPYGRCGVQSEEFELFDISKHPRSSMHLTKIVAGMENLFQSKGQIGTCPNFHRTNIHLCLHCHKCRCIRHQAHSSLSSHVYMPAANLCTLTHQTGTQTAVSIFSAGKSL